MDRIEDLALKYFADVPPFLREQVVVDLQGIGVTERFFGNVHVGLKVSDVKRWVVTRFKMGQNVIMFGTFGTGKTQIINQAAAELGYDLITDATSTKLPEDFGGIPLPVTRNMSDQAFNAMIASNLRTQKLDKAVNDELVKLRRSRSFTNEKLARKSLERKLYSTITVTDEEIQAAQDKYSRERIEQRISAPDWVFKIIDNYAINHKKTVMFFDEINQAPQQTLNTLFGLIQQKRFGDRAEYSLADAVIFAGAGNFLRDNASLVDMSQPLLDRFKFIIYFAGDWDGSINWIKNSYKDMRDEYPHLAEFLADGSISTESWSAIFASPRAIEDFISNLADLEEISQTEGPEGLKDITDLDSAGLSARNKNSTIAVALTRFLVAIGCPIDGYSVKTGLSGKMSNANRTNRDIIGFTKAWQSYMTSSTRYKYAGREYEKTASDMLDLYRALYANYPAITREGLDNIRVGASSKSCLQELQDAGIDDTELPVT